MRVSPWFSSAFLAAGLSLAQAQMQQGPMAPEAPPTYMLDAKTGKRMHIDFNTPLKPISNADLRLSEFAKRKLLIFYFSAKCPHCQHAVPFVQKLADEIVRKGYSSVAIAIKYNTDDDIRGFIRDFNVRMPILQDDDRTFGDAYGTGTIPVLYLVNEKGEFIRYVNFYEDKTPQQILDVIAAEAPPAKKAKVKKPS